MLIPKLPTFDIDTGASDVLIDNIQLVDVTSIAVIGKSADIATGALGPSRVTLRQISGDYNLDQAKDTVVVNGGQNLRFLDGKMNGGYVGAVPNPLPDTAMIRFAPKNLIDTYSIINWGSQAKGTTQSGGNVPLQRFGFVIDCTTAACVNGTMTGTNVFDHVSEAGILIKSGYVSTADPEDVKFGGMVAVGLRSSADTGVSRKVDWQGKGFFRGYVEVGSRLQATDTALLVVAAAPNAGAFQPPIFESCTFRSTAPSGSTLPLAFDIAAPCSIVNCTIENSGAPRIARLGRVTGSPVWRMDGCDVADVIDPTIMYVTSGPSPMPTPRNPLAVVTSNKGVFEDSVLDTAAASGPFNVGTARWLRTGSSDPSTTSSGSRKAIYDKLVQALYDQQVFDRFGFLALLTTRDQELSLHDLLLPTRRYTISGSPIFTADKGWQGVTAATVGLLNTGYVPANDPKLVTAGADQIALLTCCAAPSIQSGASDWDIGCGPSFRMSVRNTSDAMMARLGASTTAQSSTTSTNSVGTFLCNRFGGNATFWDANGQRGTAQPAGSSPALATLPLTLCGTGTSATGRIIRAAGVLKGFDPAGDATKITSMIGAFQACFAAIDAL